MCTDYGLWFGMLSFRSKRQQQHGGWAKIRLDYERRVKNDGSGCEKQKPRKRQKKNVRNINKNERGAGMFKV